MYFLPIVFTFSCLTHLSVLIYLILHDLILNVSYYLYTSKQRYVLFLYYVQTYALFIFCQHPSPHILTSPFANAQGAAGVSCPGNTLWAVRGSFEIQPLRRLRLERSRESLSRS